MSPSKTNRSKINRSKINIVKAFLASVVGTGLSRVMGAARDVALGHLLGAGSASDAFWIAFTVPNVFRRFVADEGLTGAMIPALSRAEAEEGEGRARAFAGRTLAVLAIASILLAIVGVLTAPYLVMAFAWGFTRDPALFALTVSLTRLLFPFVLFVSLVSWCEGVLNHRGHFFIPKIAPGLVSAGIIGGAGYAWMGAGGEAIPPETAVWAVSWGVLGGGLIHLLVCIPPVIHYWGVVRPTLRGLVNPRFMGFLREMGKVVAIGVLAQINIMVLRQLASLLEAGAVTHYWYANRVVDLAQGAIAVGVGSAVLPAISQDVAAEDWAAFRNHFARAVRLAALVLLPTAGLLLALGEPVVSVLFLHGAFDAADAAVTAHTLWAMVPFMLSVAGINIVKRAYFALEQRNMLLVVGGVGIVLTTALGYLLAPSLGVEGLALALSLSTAVQLAAYLFLLRGRVQGGLDLGALWGPLARMSLAAVPAGAAAFAVAAQGAWPDGPTLSNVSWLALAGATAVVCYAGVARALGVQDLVFIYDKIRARL